MRPASPPSWPCRSSSRRRWKLEANPQKPPNPAKAPWYFLGLQELVAYDAFWGGLGIPGLVVIGLMAIPYVDRHHSGIGRWFAKSRRTACTLWTLYVVAVIVLIIIGTYFRGPNWALVLAGRYAEGSAVGRYLAPRRVVPMPVEHR